MRTTKFRCMANACARILIAALALLSCFGCFTTAARAESDGMVRVKLARLGSPQTIEMVADCDYYLAADPSVRIPAGAVAILDARDGSLTLTAGSRVATLGASARLMRSRPGSVGVQFTSPALSGRFCGDLGFSVNGDVITTVLRIYVEDYLYGVVGYEMAPTSGLEALKAQAIVSRNYALRQKITRAGAAYDLIDSGDALSYRGYNSAAEYADVLKAVDETRGQALYYDGSPATCYFCDSNGGQIESAANATGEALPYSSLRDDPYDYEGSGAKKTASLRKDAQELAPELARALQAAAAGQLKEQGMTAAELNIDAIEAVAPGQARYEAPSRVYESLLFQLAVTGKTDAGEAIAARVQVEIPTYGGLESWCDLSINDEDNETVWVSETDRTFEITFRRNGAGLGMSRRGAQVMAKKGFSCAEILEYYYPGCEAHTLELADATRDAHGASQAAAIPDSDPVATARLSQKTRLYANADESVAAITTLPAGATVAVFAVQGDWAALGSGGVYGFAHTDALTDFTLVGVTAAQVKDEALAKVGTAVNVLQLPVEGANTLDHLLSGDTVRLTGYTDAWAQVATQSGVHGYIPRDALTLQAVGGSDGEIVTAPQGQIALLTGDAGLYVNADDTVAPRETLASGGYVQLLAYNQAWAYVRTEDGGTGYVKLDSLSAVQSAPQPTPTPEPARDEAVTVVEGEVYRYVSAEALPMFAEPASDSPVLATLSTGEQVRLGAYNDEWACVRADGLTGFVLLGGLTDQAPAQPNEEIDGGEVTVVEGEQFATVIRDETALYPSWDDSQEPLTLMKQGERVQLGAYNRRWACVRVDGLTGFMPIEALELNAAAVPELDDGVSYLECEAEATARVELYEHADLTGNVTAELNKGSRLHVYAFNQTIAYVEYNGARGFVALRFLNKVD